MTGESNRSNHRIFETIRRGVNTYQSWTQEKRSTCTAYIVNASRGNRVLMSNRTTTRTSSVQNRSGRDKESPAN